MASNLSYPLPTLLELCSRFPTIKAIKDQFGDGNLHERQIRELKALARPVNTLTTHSAWLLGSLALGCDGLLSGAGSVIARPAGRAVSCRSGRRSQGGAGDQRPDLSDCRAFYDAPLLDMHNRMKEALVILGRLDEAHVRPPLMKPTPIEIDKIRRLLAEAGLTPETLYRKVA